MDEQLGSNSVWRRWDAFVDRFPTLYRLAARLSRWFPATIGRMRLFAVLAIQLDGTISSTTDVEASQSAAGVELGWIDSESAASNVGSLFDTHCAAMWDGVQCIGLAAYRDRQPVGIVWLHAGPFMESDFAVQVSLGPNDRWLFGAEVTRSARRMGIYRALLQRLCRDLEDQGVDRILLAVTSGNGRSRTAHKSAGARVIGAGLVVRLGHQTWLWTDIPEVLRLASTAVVSP